jgi:hypothetical protein
MNFNPRKMSEMILWSVKSVGPQTMLRYVGEASA